MNYDFEEATNASLTSSIEITYDSDFEQRVLTFSEQIAIAKQTEIHHSLDCNNEVKRFSTGIFGEYALEKLLGIDIIDWTVGDSKDYNNPDIPGYRVGIKTVEYGKFPVIFKIHYYPQMICVLRREQRKVHVCGLATVPVLNRYQDIDLIMSPALKARGTKTGFYGFDYLERINSLSDLEVYKKI